MSIHHTPQTQSYHLIRLFSLVIGIIICTMITSVSLAQKQAYAETPAEIVTKIEQLRHSSLQSKLNKANFSTIPNYISIRIYKEDAEIEIWAGHNNKDPMTLLAVYPICAMGFNPGTKLKEGDERTPEGSFNISFLKNSKQWYMHINLNNDHLDDEGNEKTDPSFYACTDYPTKFDKQLSASIGVKKPGSGICLHGNCVSVGCASMQNHDFVEIYYWMMQHDVKAYGAPRVHILPFRYYEPCDENLQNHDLKCPTINNCSLQYVAAIASQETPELTKLGSTNIEALWSHIRERERVFIQTPTPTNAELELSMDILKNTNISK